jgi:4-amino-4-deoxy-L-arabinose transferase-like glycosyltransferase
MAVQATRLFIFTLFPLLLAWIVNHFDRTATSRERKLEVVLIFLFTISVAGSGIANFFAHFFLSDIVAAFIGWDAGSPFQLEVAFANLTLGVMGIVAAGRRDGFREATVLAVTIFAVGATIVHLMDMVATGNLAPGNSLQNVINLARPALLIWALLADRRAEAGPDAETGTVEFDRWRSPLLQASAPLTISISTAYGLGFALGQPWLLTLLGAAIGIGIVVSALSRSPLHDLALRRPKTGDS